MQLLLNEVDPSELLEIRLAKCLTDDEYFEFCQANDHLRIERTAEGEIVLMSRAGAETSFRNASLAAQLHIWTKGDGGGKLFDSNTEFILPNGAALSPDASWVSNQQLGKLTRAQKRLFPPLCPEFVVELTSPSDHLLVVMRKMNEWMKNGVVLGWLIDADARTVYIYRPNQEPERRESIEVLPAEEPLKGFTLDLREIWAGL